MGSPQRDAQTVGVTLIGPETEPDTFARDQLTRRPTLPGDGVPDVVIGHGRVSGPHARQLVEEHYPDAKRFQFVHVKPDQLEFEKEPGNLDPTALAEQRTAAEIGLAQGAFCAVAVGPVLFDWLNLYIDADKTGQSLLRLDPGFDITEGEERIYRNNHLAQVLIAGRLTSNDAPVKGLADIAARSLGLHSASCWTQTITRSNWWYAALRNTKDPLSGSVYANGPASRVFVSFPCLLTSSRDLPG
ncbi:hypothetical protein [Nocardia aurea]|uniref:hypothetical protein n=1 Tax=Nocardia aurea TaxID=2144174 RepID=UPI0018E543FC|nr:hypothetical protein [Nocardia aurea]